MPEVNFLAIIVAALIPSILGSIYYGPLFGKQWYDSLGKTKEDMVPNNMALTYGLALLGAFVLSYSMKMVIEGMHKGVENGELVFNSFHTFGHGALHGALACVFLICPVLLSMSLFHKKSGKNIALNLVFWILCCSIMGGILDSWN